MTEINSVQAIVGIGLYGDRYALGTGAFSKSKKAAMWQVSLIAVEAFREAIAKLEVPFTLSETRRNIVTEGVDLNSLVGKEFQVGEVRMRGSEWCNPCGRPSLFAQKSGFKEAFEAKGGLLTEVLSTGIIHVGDSITL